MTNQMANELNDLADSYTGAGMPFIFLGRDGPRLIGCVTERSLRMAQGLLDAKLVALGLGADRLSLFRTPCGSLGYLAHGS